MENDRISKLQAIADDKKKQEESQERQKQAKIKELTDYLAERKETISELVELHKKSEEIFGKHKGLFKYADGISHELGFRPGADYLSVMGGGACPRGDLKVLRNGNVEFIPERCNYSAVERKLSSSEKIWLLEQATNQLDGFADKVFQTVDKMYNSQKSALERTEAEERKKNETVTVSITLDKDDLALLRNSKEYGSWMDSDHIDKAQVSSKVYAVLKDALCHEKERDAMQDFKFKLELTPQNPVTEEIKQMLHQLSRADGTVLPVWKDALASSPVILKNPHKTYGILKDAAPPEWTEEIMKKVSIKLKRKAAQEAKQQR